MSAKELRQELTKIVIDRLEKGIPPSRLLWNPLGGGRLIRRPRRFNGEPYRGGNLLRLALQMIESAFGSPYWFTARQADQLGAEIRHQAIGTTIYFCGSTTKLTQRCDGRNEERQMFFERSFVVFNADQCRGLPLGFHAAFQKPVDAEWGSTRSDEFFTRVGARVQSGGNRASYNPVHDFIRMPHRSDFIDAQSYESVMCHEHVHWTGHHSRLDRHLERSWFGDPEYAFEELVAELGAAFFCSEFGITPAIRDDHISYLGHWLKVLRNDDHAIYSAATRASDALDFLNRFQPQLTCTPNVA